LNKKKVKTVTLAPEARALFSGLMTLIKRDWSGRTRHPSLATSAFLAQQDLLSEIFDKVESRDRIANFWKTSRTESTSSARRGRLHLQRALLFADVTRILRAVMTFLTGMQATADRELAEVVHIQFTALMRKTSTRPLVNMLLQFIATMISVKDGWQDELVHLMLSLNSDTKLEAQILNATEHVCMSTDVVNLVVGLVGSQARDYGLL
jgi:hypothetical protein